ncbi:MAG: nitrogen fixation protein NifQ [Bacteroidales bacterium]
MAAQAYGRLMAGGGGDPFDRHLFACVTALARSERRPLAVGLGLSAEALAALVGEYFPHAPELLNGIDPDRDGSQPLTAEESALRDLLLRHRTAQALEEGWLAHVIARRALSGRPLWQDMGMASHADLNLMLAFHFTTLATRNHAGMRWKAFLRRELELENGMDCRAATRCESCRHHDRCFGPEPGASLILMSNLP